MSTKETCGPETCVGIARSVNISRAYELPEMLTWRGNSRSVCQSSGNASNEVELGSSSIRSGLLELGNHFLQEQLVHVPA